MGFRFRQSVRLFPGVRINVSKTGASLSAGVRGAHINVGKTGVHESVGVPGTGLSYRTGNLAKSAPPARGTSTGRTRLILWTALLVVVAIFGKLLH